MLQIRLIIITVFAIASGLFASDYDPEWILENAFEKEILYLDPSEIVLPAEMQNALEKYNSGQFRYASELLEKIRNLNLPDGQLDLVSLALAECYRQLGMHKKAREQYRFVLQYFPSNDKAAPALYRLMEYAAGSSEIETADSILTVFQETYSKHPLLNAALYISGVLHYRHQNYEESLDLLSRIPKNYRHALNAGFITALCYIRQNQLQKAQVVLEEVRHKSKNPDLSSEAAILIGDIYYQQGNAKAALDYYRTISRDSRRYQLSLVKIARSLLEIKQYQDARDIARRFLSGNKNSPYYFEMASILEQAYTGLGNQKAASQVSNLIHRQILDARLKFEVFEEIDRLTDMAKNWQIIEYDAIKNQDEKSLILARGNIDKIKNLQKKFDALLDQIDPLRTDEKGDGKKVPNLAERRYLVLLKERIARLENSLRTGTKELEILSQSLRNTPSDSSTLKVIDSIAAVIKAVEQEKTDTEQEYYVVLEDCFENDSLDRKADEEMQARFVDWAFLKYLDKKEGLKKLAQEVSKVRKSTGTGREEAVKQGDKQVNEQDIGRLEAGIKDDRERLISHIETMIEVYPRNRYNPQILFRLAELYYDQANDDFEVALREYEKKMASGGDSAVFPEYRLEKTIELYDRIITLYPRGEMTDDAMFYKAMAQQKQGMEEEAIATLKELVQKYPEGEYFVEANMNIGRYYFDHPRVDSGRGYNLAMDAFRKVLFYRDHPQFIQALYHLGWCYYMLDNYDEAIAVFKYLIEEADLDFDPSKMEEKQVVNPLLRGEAVDYIAISFDEGRNVEDAIKFLKLVGNTDYSALVLKRIGELREEDLDFKAAISVYKRLLEEYPFCRLAPEVNVNLIKLFESQGTPDSANLIRQQFYDLYSKGGEWQKAFSSRDSQLVATVDSMAISIGLFVADASYREAEESRNSAGYEKAAENYRKLVELYPEHPNAAEAQWNLAVILDTKLLDKPGAYNQYINFSRKTSIDSYRREMAALNAIGIAQALLPPDSLVQKGSVDFAGLKVLESVNNYAELFPNGLSLGKVLLSMGAVYFNRQIYPKAIEVYDRILKLGPQNAQYYEALLLSGQCYFGEENWPGAIKAFQRVWKESGDRVQRETSYKLLLQAEFLNARKLFTEGNFQNAAAAFLSIEQKYPGSEYGDAVLFNAAEAFEKNENWADACNSYGELVKKYPYSKLAPAALFNAASDYEKANRYNRAAESYEMIVANYPESDKAKDALFNLGFCYEKLGKLDKMAEVNERYSSLYPEEKDVEAILLRSAAFYAKAAMYEKAVTLYRNFVRRFPRSVKAIEALFMIAKCSYEQKDIENAILGFQQVEQQNVRFAQEGLETNNFYAAEAAYYLGNLKREQFLQIKFQLPESQLKNSLKEKSDLLAEAAKAYQRVLHYQSERMFEAACRVGMLYEELSDAWEKQERPKIDPIKGALLEKEIYTAASQLLQKSFVPYKKAIEISINFDSLGSDQRQWVQRANRRLTESFRTSGQYLLKAIAAMQNAPVPKEIKGKPLHYYQYLKQIIETLAPLKADAVKYYEYVLDQIDSLKLSDTSTVNCQDDYVYVNYLLGSGYDSLSVEILKNAGNVSDKMSEDEREDLLFQLEDIVFELQDNAIFAYEDALKNIRGRKLQNNRWHGKILESLARLSPGKYGASFFQKEVFRSGVEWITRADSVEKWNGFDPPQDGWSQALKTGQVSIPGMKEKVPVIWGNKDWNNVYFWKNVFLNGMPQRAALYLAAGVKYRLFINGTLAISDSAGDGGLQRIDSLSEVSSLVKGGDNVICVEATATDSVNKGIAIVFTAMIDTTQKYKSTVKLPRAAARSVSGEKKEKPVPEKQTGKTELQGAQKEESKEEKSFPDYVYKYKNHGELMKAIKEYQDKETTLSSEIKKERMEIQKLRLRSTELDEEIRRVREQIETVRAKRESMSREK